MDFRNTELIFGSKNLAKIPDGGVYVATNDHRAASNLEHKNTTIKKQGETEFAFDNSVQAMASDPSLGIALIVTQLADSLATWFEVNLGRNEALDTLGTMLGLKGLRKAACAREKQTPSAEPSLG